MATAITPRMIITTATAITGMGIQGMAFTPALAGTQGLVSTATAAIIHRIITPQTTTTAGPTAPVAAQQDGVVSLLLIPEGHALYRQPGGHQLALAPVQLAAEARVRLTMKVHEI